MNVNPFHQSAPETGPFPRGMSNRIVLFAVLTAIAAFLINEVYDYDVWWNVTIGEDILTRHAVPATDTFTVAAWGRPYHDSHWLFQSSLAAAHRALGMAGVQLVMLALWASTLWVCHRAIARWATPSVGYALLFLVSMACIERFLPRPELVSYLMLALFYLLLQERAYCKTSQLAVFGLLQVMWSNSHGLFVLGPCLAGCYWLVAVVEKKRAGENDLSALTRLMLVLIAATLVTPSVFGGWKYAFLLFTEVGADAPQVMKNIAELSPTFGKPAASAPAFWFFAGLLALTVASAAIAGIRKPVALSRERALIVALLFALSFTGRRNMVLFALVAGPFVAEQFRLVAWPERWSVRGAAPVFALVVLVFAWYPLSGKYYLAMNLPTRFGFGATPSFFPHGLWKFLDERGFSGTIYNSNVLGGFYLYQGYPGRLPLTDGRWEIYDQQQLETIQFFAPHDPVLWNKLVAQYKIQGVLLQHSSGDARSLLPALNRDARWRLVYYDHAASFWMRTGTPGLPPAVDLTRASGLPKQPVRAEDCIMLDAFYSDVGARDLTIANLERAVDFPWQRETALERLGGLLRSAGREEEAERVFIRLHERYPRNIIALNELAYRAFQRGDRGAAEGFLLRVLDLDPANRSARDNLDLLKGRPASAP
jgi:tetratricopeptide (TPR) repeat protein